MLLHCLPSLGKQLHRLVWKLGQSNTPHDLIQPEKQFSVVDIVGQETLGDHAGDDFANPRTRNLGGPIDPLLDSLGIDLAEDLVITLEEPWVTLVERGIEQNLDEQVGDKAAAHAGRIGRRFTQSDGELYVQLAEGGGFVEPGIILMMPDDSASQSREVRVSVGEPSGGGRRSHSDSAIHDAEPVGQAQSGDLIGIGLGGVEEEPVSVGQIVHAGCRKRSEGLSGNCRYHAVLFRSG